MDSKKLEQEYLEDKKYIHDTLKHTREHTEKLHDKLETFKLEVSTALAVIQTKLAMYVLAGSVVTGIAVNLITHSLKG